MTVWVDLADFAHLPADGRGREATEGFRLPAGAVAALRHRGVRLAVPASVTVHLVGDRRLVRADVQAQLQLLHPCDRCLDEVALGLDLHYAEEWLLAPGPEVEEEERDGELWVLRFRVAEAGQELEDGFWQNVDLALPTKVLCRNGCLGLCPRCGANRNRQRCDCLEEEGDARWAALRALGVR